MNKIIILHDLNGKPYYEAVEYYTKQKNIKCIYYESSVFKLLIRDIVKKQFSLKSIQRTIKNTIFRFKVPFIKDSTIIMGMAPNDFRIVWYRILLKNNNLIYSTSNPFWGDESKNPRKYGILTFIFNNYWKSFLKTKKLKIVTVTKSSFNTLKNNYVIDGNIFQIYHSVDTSKFHKTIREREDKVHILFAGKFLYEKGLDTIAKLIDSMDKTKYSFHIVGDGEYKDKVSYVFDYSNVTYYGWINDKSMMAQIYGKCQIFLNLSISNSKWQELFGIVNIEAMASGLVVIASNHIGPSEIIENKINGFLVEEKQYLEVKRIIEYLYKNNNEYNKISTNAVSRAKDFSIENISKKWEKVING